MSHDVARETYIALRARREAYHVASDMIYEAPIDVRTVACGGCGGWIEVRASTITDPLTCPACKARTPLPPYLRGKYMPRARSRTPSLEACPPDDIYLVGDFTDAPIPRWLIWFTLALLAAGAGVIGGLLRA